MDIILQGLDHVASIQDDILITGKDDDEHIKNLDSVLSHLDYYGLRLQLSKCKFIQESVTDQLQSHLVKNNLFPTLQSAYRPNHSTETALLKIKNDILMNMDKQHASYPSVPQPHL